jgi:protein gp37
MAARIEAMGNRACYRGTTKKVNGHAVWTGKMARAPELTLTAPLRRKKPTMWFVNSMSDLFHEKVPVEWIDDVLAIMALCPQHTFQVLTKRAERMLDYFLSPSTAANLSGQWQERVCGAIDKLVPQRTDRSRAAKDAVIVRPLPNVWLGTSCERQKEADERIPFLLRTPASVRFVSAEPLLGPIDFTALQAGPKSDVGVYRTINALTGERGHNGPCGWTPAVDPRAQHLDWVIVGGESGHGARPMNSEWAVSIRDQCVQAGVSFFFKQWGTWSATGARAATKTRKLMGREWNEMPSEPRP